MNAPTTQVPNGSDPDAIVLLTVAETCTQLRVSRSTIYQLIQRGQLRTIQIGRRRLVPAASVAEFIDVQVRDGDLP